MKKIMLLSVLLFALQSVSVSAGGYNPYNKKKRVNPVYNLQTGEQIDRAVSRLRVRDDGVCVTTRTRDLPPGAYTSWWTIYNNPQACTEPEDFGGAQCGHLESRVNPAAEGTVMAAQSFIVGPNGRAHVNACVGVGELTHFVLRGNGLGNPFGAEIQHVLRYHGPAAYGDSALLGAQLNEFAGGCQTDTQEGFECFDPQITYHPLPQNYGY